MRKKRTLKISTIFQFLLGAAAVIFFVSGIMMLMDQYRQSRSRIQEIASESLRQEGEYRVLFLSSYSQSHFSVPLQWQGLKEGFDGQSVVLDTEYMDRKNHPEEETFRLFTEQLTKKLSTVSYDVLVTGDDDALSFAEEHRQDLFADCPVVFLGINNIRFAEQVHEEGWATGIPEESNFLDVFSTAADFFPDARHFVCIVDSSATGQGDLTQLSGIIGDFPGYEFDVINCSDLTQKQLIEKIEEVDAHSLIMELDAFADADGNIYTIDGMCRLLSEHSDRPIFRVSTGGVGSGAVCSGFIDFEQYGREAAAMAIAILGGQSPADIPLLYDHETAYVFDLDRMKTYGFDENDLPENSTVVSGEVPFLRQHRAILSPLLRIFLAAILVIIVLAIGFVRADADSRKLAEDERDLRHKVYYDGLTELLNRNGLFELDASEFQSACVINVDDLKFVNEKYGYSCGDEVLKTIARRLESIHDSKAIRLGGDEFLLLSARSFLKEPDRARQLEEKLHRQYTYGTIVLDLTVSIGYAEKTEGMSTDDLLTAAELAMYHGRTIHRRRGHSFYDESIREELDRKTAIINDLLEAVRENAFTVLYQPQVVTESGNVIGFEALCRFPDNKYTPNLFIPVAEESGLIMNIDRIVTQKAVQQLAEWKEAGKELPVISINYSAKQLRDAEYANFLKDLLDENRIPHDRVKIEITESSVFADKVRSERFFGMIHDMGMQIALDDFGTGYSSITAMRALPVDFIKFDKSLIDEYLVKGHLTFITDLTAMVHDLGKKIVAEGVETEEQYRLARQIGIDQIQGYYFDRPMPAEKAIEVKYQVPLNFS